MKTLLVALLLLMPTFAGAAHYYGSCGSCYYTPTYYAPQQYYYPPQVELTYVNSVQLYQPFSFQYVPPQALLQVYGVPQITSSTVTTTTTSAVSNGTVQTQTINGNAGAQIGVGGVTTVTPGQPQQIGDGLPVASAETADTSFRGTSVGGGSGQLVQVLKQNCAKCHQGANGSGGVTLLNDQGQVQLVSKKGRLTMLDVLQAVEGDAKCPGCVTPMPPGSGTDVTKKVPAAQRKVIWDELRRGTK